MAGFGAPVAQEVNASPQQGLATIGQLLGLKQQQLGIERQQIGLSQASQQLSSETSAATQAAVHTHNMLQLQSQPWQQLYQSGGLDAVAQRASQVGGVDSPEFIGRFAHMEQAGAEAKKAAFSLNQAYLEPIRSTLAAWAGDPKGELSDLQAALEGDVEAMPKSEQSAGSQLIQKLAPLFAGPNLITGQPKSLQQQKAEALLLARAGLTTSETAGPGGLATPVAGTVSTGTQIIPTVGSRETAITQAANAPPIAQEHGTITLPNGSVAVLNRATGQYEISGGSGRGGAPSAPGVPMMTPATDPNRPSANASVQQQQAWTQSLKAANEEVQAVRSGDANYGSSMAIAQDIRQLTRGPGGRDLGPGTPEWNQLVGAITSRFGGSQGVTTRQTLESFLDRQAASATKALGLPATNLGNEQARAISGNISMQVGALRAKNDYTEALVQGLHDYRVGLDKVAGLGGEAAPTAVNRYRAQWAKYFNPMAIEYQLAQQRGDRKLMDALTKGLSKHEAKQWLSDIAAMKALSTTGEPP